MFLVGSLDANEGCGGVVVVSTGRWDRSIAPQICESRGSELLMCFIDLSKVWEPNTWYRKKKFDRGLQSKD